MAQHRSQRGGRSIAAAGSTKRPLEYYFAAAGGGLWKTTDGGTTWKPVTDGQLDTAAVGGVAVCEANPGRRLSDHRRDPAARQHPARKRRVEDGRCRQDVEARSDLPQVQNFSRVRIHPTDCNTVYVGGFGHYGAPNPERGAVQDGRRRQDME